MVLENTKKACHRLSYGDWMENCETQAELRTECRAQTLGSFALHASAEGSISMFMCNSIITCMSDYRRCLGW
jgi:hypothetical protein